MERTPVVERAQQWLDKAGGAVGGAQVRPALQLVRERKVPVGLSRGLVPMQAGMDAEAGALDARAEVEIGGCCRDGIGTEDREAGHRPPFEGAGEIGERRRHAPLDPVGRYDEIHRRPQPRVDPVGERVPFRGERGSRQDKRAALMRLEIVGGRESEAPGLVRQVGRGQTGS